MTPTIFLSQDTRLGRCGLCAVVDAMAHVRDDEPCRTLQLQQLVCQPGRTVFCRYLHDPVDLLQIHIVLHVLIGFVVYSLV